MYFFSSSARADAPAADATGSDPSVAGVSPTVSLPFGAKPVPVEGRLVGSDAWVRFESQGAAARHWQLDRAAVSKCLSLTLQQAHTKGYEFRRCDACAGPRRAASASPRTELLPARILPAAVAPPAATVAKGTSAGASVGGGIGDPVLRPCCRNTVGCRGGSGRRHNGECISNSAESLDRQKAAYNIHQQQQRVQQSPAVQPSQEHSDAAAEAFLKTYFVGDPNPDGEAMVELQSKTDWPEDRLECWFEAQRFLAGDF